MTTTLPATTAPTSRREAAAVLDEAVALARDLGRDDVAASLARDGSRLLDPGARVLVVGDHKQGKSSLVDALVGTDLCPAHADVATALPTVVAYSEEPYTVLVGPHGREDVTAARLAGAVTGRDDRAWVQAEIGRDVPVLAAGLTLIDTPGAGGPGGAPGVAVLGELPAADAVLLVSDASRELTAGEVELLAAAAGHVATVVVALTRTDLHPAWREVRDLDAALLAARGLVVDVVGVSAELARHARTRDGTDLGRELAAASGVPALAELLRRRVVEPRGCRTERALQRHVAEVLRDVRAVPVVELAALEGPARARELDEALAAATARAAATKERSARWQQTLADGVADLGADVDWDLRDRVRQVLRTAEETLETVDPAQVWDQFEPWLAEEIGRAVATTYLWAGERTWWLAERVAAHFADPGAEPGVEGTEPVADGAPVPAGRFTAELSALPELGTPDLDRMAFTQGLLVGLRGSYGGVLMVGLVTTLSGMALINPFSVGAGVLLGGRTLRDERRRALRRRRLDARRVVRQHADEVQFVVGKHTKDMLREVQRTLRDHFTARAEEVATGAAAAVVAATGARDLDAERRRRRTAEVRAELARLDDVLARCAT
ncbi:dynamin family protein [Actinomycetospora aeridis]|uniref:Dynamin family protein n=1 Tax=Actinomycetospora aeridis TaxID=3129231 RepID=A0ABU8NBK0_9PSEU